MSVWVGLLEVLVVGSIILMLRMPLLACDACRGRRDRQLIAHGVGSVVIRARRTLLSVAVLLIVPHFGGTGCDTMSHNVGEGSRRLNSRSPPSLEVLLDRAVQLRYSSR